MGSVSWSEETIWDVVSRAASADRCVCGCGRYSAKDTFSSPECFNKEEEDVVY